MKQVLYATGNKGKWVEVSSFLGQWGIDVIMPSVLGIDLEVPEIGKTLEENAKLKVRSYLKHLENKPELGDLVVVADDTGLEIDVLGGKPGLHVRRWKDGVHRMTDDEIVRFCLSEMEGIPPESRGAQFRTVVAVACGEELWGFDGKLRGLIMETAQVKYETEGLPFEQLFYVPSWGMMLGEQRRLSMEERLKYKTHREMAFENAARTIWELAGGGELRTEN